MNFKKDLENLLNIHSKENDSNTPDFILASYIGNCLHAFTEATQQRESWYGRDDSPSSVKMKNNMPVQRHTNKS